MIIDGGQSTISTVDKLAWAMDETNNTPLNVKLQAQNSGIKQDASGAFILSDAPSAATTVQLATGGTTVIDTTGYQTIHLTTNATFAATGGIAFSNDGVTFVQAPMSTVPGVFATALIASTNYTIPVQGRFAKIIATSAGQFTYYLRNIPSQLTHQNLSAIGGTATVNGGLAGVLSVGGGSAIAIAPTTNPIHIAGVDSGILTRRLLCDTVGSLSVGGAVAVGSAPAATSFPLITGGIDPAGAARRLASTMLGDLITGNRTIPSSNAALSSATTGNAPIATGGFTNQVALAVQDTSTYEGQSQVEILGLILQEMKIMNQQLYELPRVMAAQMNGYPSPAINPQPYLGDEPTQMRNDASLFINQQ
jgi:hypothetical protein